MKDFLTYIVKSIVKDPDSVVIEETEENGVFMYKINVAKEDMGIIIGKEGRTIKSVRELARSKAIRDNLQIRVELVEQPKEDA